LRDHRRRLPDGAGGRRDEAAAPHFVETPLTAHLVADPAVRKEAGDRANGSERPITPDEMTAAILSPASDTAAAVARCVRVVDSDRIRRSIEARSEKFPKRG
jgi:NAD(P)-dependent dehydrogenase (short-subunit alcohol dehydrogenase family)